MLDFIIEKARVALWRRSHRDFLVIFNWHQITPEFDPIRHHKYTWTPLDLFNSTVEALASEFEILPLHKAIDQIARGSLRGPCAALTFDDGDASVAEYVAPILHRHQLPATFFINSAYLDGRGTYWFPIVAYLSAVADAPSHLDLYDGLILKAQQLRLTKDPIFYNDVRRQIEQLAPLVPDGPSRLVSREWLASLDGDQFSIGAHGHEHQRFSLMSEEWQRRDLRENKEQLSQFKGFRPIFAIPFGRPWDWNEHTIRAAREQSLEVVFANGGINTGSGDILRIPCDGHEIRKLLTRSIVAETSVRSY